MDRQIHMYIERLKGRSARGAGASMWLRNLNQVGENSVSGGCLSTMRSGTTIRWTGYPGRLRMRCYSIRRLTGEAGGVVSLPPGLKAIPYKSE
jgi:hypothetical protein